MNLGARVKGFHACLKHLRGDRGKEEEIRVLPVVIGGRSMGARAAVLAAGEIVEQDKKDRSVASTIQVVLVSYPLKGPKDDIRDGILLHLPESVRVLFIIGDRDAMCPLHLLESVRGKMKAKSQLIVVNGADHGMHVKPANRECAVGEETGRLAAEWVRGTAFQSVRYIGEEG